MQYVSQSDFHDLASRGVASNSAVERMGRVARAPDDGSRTARFVFSDGTVDRMNDRIDPNGWQLDGFRKNPVALWAHQSTEPPIGRVTRTFVSDERLMGDIQFASAEVYPFADTVYRLVREGFIKSVSVGFMPILWDWADGADRRGGIDFEKQELLEISVVPIPANTNALIEARAKSPARRGSALAARSTPPSVFSFAGTAMERQAQLDWARPDLSEAAQLEAQIRAMMHIGPPDTSSGRRQWVDTLQRLHRRALR
jgi:HK97 family phage prohead protease